MEPLKYYEFELSDKQINDREKLITALKNNKTIQSFMERYDCPFEVVEDNMFRFKDWLEALNRVHQLNEETLREDPSRGAYVNLVYDSVAGVLLDEYKVVPTVEKLVAENAHLKQYVVFPLSKSLQEASFSVGKFDDRTLLAVDTLISFVENDVLGYYIHGNLGVGKSYLAACVSNEMAKRGSDVAFVSVADLLSHLKQNFNRSYEVDYTLDNLKQVDLLVIDDLGAEPISAWGRDEVLLPLLNHRLENYRKTIFTSNYPMDMLEDLYSLDQRGNFDQLRAKRFVDRIFAISEPLLVLGKNRRHNR